MGYLRVFGLGIAAMALLAIVVAGSASAAVLCKNNTTTEGCSGIYKAGTTVHLQLVKNASLVLENAEFQTTITGCSASTFESTTDKDGAEGVPVTFSVLLESYKWTCTSPTSTIAGGKYEIEWIPKTDNGTMKVTNFQVRVETLFGPCIWGTGAAAIVYGTVVGGTPATVVVNNITLTPVAGAGCAKTVKMRGTYEFTSPNPLFIAKK